MFGYVYLTTNSINNKKYIGKHISDKFEPDKYVGSGKLLLKAIEKYGKENFKCEILEECYSKEHLNEREIYWIDYYKATELDCFYNLANGGDGGDLSNYIDYSKCVKYNKDNWNFGKHYKWYNDGERDIRVFDGDIINDNYFPGRLLKLSDDAKQKISSYRKGKPPINKGIAMSDEQKLKVSNSRKGKCCGDSNPSKRQDVRNKLSQKYICPICNNYVSSKSCITRHIRKYHLDFIESASTIESITYEKYISE